ncbi:MAG: M42 family peptidase [Oscillospiraceae bacterium]|nr:M42 family peptidase [Oscillospiraceae bacterium]
MLNKLESLCGLYGVSGREDAVREYIISQIRDKAEFHTDNSGNLIVFKKGRQVPKNKVMLAAHMDEVGFIVTFITDDGYLRFDTVGGIDASVLSGRSVLVGGRLVPGVIGVKPVHLLKSEEKENYPEKDMLYIDIGAPSKARAGEAVSVGDAAYFDSDFVEFGDGFVKGRAIDDRAGCALMLHMIGGELEFDTWFAFTAQEETGSGGAFAAAFAVEPDYSIVLEATTAADIAGVKGEKRVCALGGGAAISFMDRGTIYPRDLFDRAFELARENGVKAQPKTLVAGSNDAAAVFKSRAGVRVLTLSLPCRYIHSPSCVISAPDLYETEKLARLLAADFARR